MYVRLEPGPGAYGAAASHRLALRAQATRTWRDMPHFAVDLGEDVGTASWWRGALLCLGLCAVTLQLAPNIRPLAGPVPPALTGAAREASRGQAIRPLAKGGQSGLRLAATPLAKPVDFAPERPRIALTMMVNPGDRLDAALVRNGVSAGDALRVAALLGPEVGASGSARDSAQPVIPVSLTLGGRPHPGAPRALMQLDMRARFDLAVRIERVGGGLVLRRQPIRIDSQPVRISGRTGAGLYQSLRASGANFAVAQAYLRALAMHVDFETDVPAGARFDLIVAHQRAETGEVRTGALLYAGLNTGQKHVQLLPWTIDGVAGWYDAATIGERRMGMIAPVAARVSSGFGFRLHPLLGYSRLHKGMDYAAVHGTPIRAVTDGVVAQAGWSGGYGQMVRLNHAAGLGTGYAHMSRIAVSPGQRVMQGQVIGYVGSTGLSTGPHLHFEVYRNGVAVNPQSVAFESGALLAGEQLAAFRARLKSVLASAAPIGQRPAATALAQATAPR